MYLGPTPEAEIRERVYRTNLELGRRVRKEHFQADNLDVLVERLFSTGNESAIVRRFFQDFPDSQQIISLVIPYTENRDALVVVMQNAVYALRRQGDPKDVVSIAALFNQEAVRNIARNYRGQVAKFFMGIIGDVARETGDAEKVKNAAEALDLDEIRQVFKKYGEAQTQGFMYSVGSTAHLTRDKESVRRTARNYLDHPERLGLTQLPA